MLRDRIRQLTDSRARAEKHLKEIQVSIRALGDEDLLDLADIFKDTPGSILSVLAVAEMANRKISS